MSYPFWFAGKLISCVRLLELQPSCIIQNYPNRRFHPRSLILIQNLFETTLFSFTVIMCFAKNFCSALLGSETVKSIEKRYNLLVRFYACQAVSSFNNTFNLHSKRSIGLHSKACEYVIQHILSKDNFLTKKSAPRIQTGHPDWTVGHICY